MKVLIQKELIIVVGIILMLISGCAQQEQMDVKMSRLVAAENMKLKEELRQQDWEIESLKEQYEQQVKKLEDMIAEYKEQIKAWEEKSRQNVRDQVEGVLDAVVEQNAKLKAENMLLREEVKELKKQLASPDEPEENEESVPEVPL